jgi:hypothetical protein
MDEKRIVTYVLSRRCDKRCTYFRNFDRDPIICMIVFRFQGYDKFFYFFGCCVFSFHVWKGELKVFMKTVYEIVTN